MLLSFTKYGRQVVRSTAELSQLKDMAPHKFPKMWLQLPDQKTATENLCREYKIRKRAYNYKVRKICLFHNMLCVFIENLVMILSLR